MLDRRASGTVVPAAIRRDAADAGPSAPKNAPVACSASAPAHASSAVVAADTAPRSTSSGDTSSVGHKVRRTAAGDLP